MNRLKRTKNKIVAEAFPELTGVRVDVRWKKMKNTYLLATFQRRKSAIDADSTLKKASNSILEGGMAHELAHIARFYDMWVFLRWLDIHLYNMSHRYQTWDEKRTDLMVIERGYGEQLYKFALYRDEQRRIANRPNTRDGLTAEEIRNLLNRKKIISLLPQNLPDILGSLSKFHTFVRLGTKQALEDLL